MKARTSRESAFTLVEIMIVAAILGLLAAIAVPNFVRARTNAQTKTCINNLRQIDSAKQQWALENRQAANALPLFSDISSYLHDSVVCPAAGADTNFSTSYTLNDVSTWPECIFVGSAGGHVLTDTSSSSGTGNGGVGGGGSGPVTTVP